jgi:hypothetical protein
MSLHAGILVLTDPAVNTGGTDVLLQVDPVRLGSRVGWAWEAHPTRSVLCGRGCDDSRTGALASAVRFLVRCGELDPLFAALFGWLA